MLVTFQCRCSIDLIMFLLLFISNHLHFHSYSQTYYILYLLLCYYTSFSLLSHLPILFFIGLFHSSNLSISIRFPQSSIFCSAFIFFSTSPVHSFLSISFVWLVRFKFWFSFLLNIMNRLCLCRPDNVFLLPCSSSLL